MAISRCMGKYAKRAHLHLRDYLIPPGPGPVWNERAHRINQERVQRVIERAASRDVGVAHVLTALHGLRYGQR